MNNTTPNTARQNTSAPVRKPGPLPSSLDDLKVSELKTELKLRGLPVSGTKPDLIERLKPYQEMNSSGVAAGGIVAVSTSAIVTSSPEVAMALPVTALHSSVTSSGPAFKAELPSAGAGGVAHVENVSSPLPISPSPSEQSSLSAEDTSVADTFTEIMTMMSPSQFLCSSPLRATSNEDSLSPTSSTLSNLELDAAEKDRKLQEKEKQIEELKRKLEQEQKLVEVLKMQLEVEKRGQQQQQRPLEPPPGTPAPPGGRLDPPRGGAAQPVKDEAALTDCPVPPASHPAGQPGSAGGQTLVAKKAVVIKQEGPTAPAEPQSAAPPFFASPQGQPPPAVGAQPQALLTAQTAQLLLPVSIQGSGVTSVQLPVGSLRLQTPPQAGIQTQPQIAAATLSSGLAQTVPQKQDTFTPHVLSQPQQVRKVGECSRVTSCCCCSRRPLSRPHVFVGASSVAALVHSCL